MLLTRRGPWIVIALVVLAWAPAAQATTVVPVADADLVGAAIAIVLADVKAIESRWDPAQRLIFTVITLDVRDSLKGEIPLGPLTIRQLGGRVAGMHAWIQGSPSSRSASTFCCSSHAMPTARCAWPTSIRASSRS